MKKWVVTLLKTIAFLAVCYGALLGIVYFMLAIPTERELWRISEYRVSNPILVNDLLIFHGYKVDHSVDCYCTYAVDKSTGEIVWSTEELATAYIEEAKGLGVGSADSTSVRAWVETVSPTTDVIYISINYWGSDHTRYNSILALKSSNGELLWKVDGEAVSDSIAGSVAEISRIFVVDNQGDLLAIDSDTGKEIWHQKVHEQHEWGENWFTYKNSAIYISTHSSECLISHCAFALDEQHYQQITAFSAETGELLWESPRLYRGRIYVFDNMMYMVSDPWDNSPEVKQRDDKLVTAIDLGTGSQKWELTFENAHEFYIFADDNKEIYVMFKSYRGGPNNFSKLAKLIVIDELSGNIVWQFNEDFSHGDLGHLKSGDTVYLGTEDGFIYALESSTGSIAWSTESGHFPYEFVVNRDTLIAVYEERFVSALDSTTGEQKWMLDLGIEDGWYYFNDEILKINGNDIYIAGNADEKIYALDLETGSILWSWKHFYPFKSEFQITFIENNLLYVNHQSDFRNLIDLNEKNWFFALKIK